MAATALLALALSLGCSSATTDSSAGSTPPVNGSGGTPPRSIDPSRRAATIAQMLDAFGLDDAQRTCISDAVAKDATFDTINPDAPATARALLRHAADCGARPALTTKYLATSSATTSTRTDCIRRLFDQLSTDDFIALVTGDTQIAKNVDTEATKTCTTPGTT
jgi:hypothetical protein